MYHLWLVMSPHLLQHVQLRQIASGYWINLAGMEFSCCVQLFLLQAPTFGTLWESTMPMENQFFLDGKLRLQTVHYKIAAIDMLLCKTNDIPSGKLTYPGSHRGWKISFH